MKAVVWVGISVVAMGVAIGGSLYLLKNGEAPVEDLSSAPVGTHFVAQLQQDQEVSDDGLITNVFIGEKIPRSELADLTPDEMKKFKLLRIDDTLNKTDPNAIKWVYRFIFENLNPFMLAEIEAHLKVVTPGSPTREMIVRMTRIPNATYGLSGPLFPYENSDFTEPATFTMPGSNWFQSTQFQWGEIRVRKFKNPLPIDTIPGLMQSFFDPNLTAEKAVEMFDSNPKLFTLQDEKYKVSATMIAFAFGNEKLIRHILANGGNPKSRDSRGAGIMHYAARGLGLPAVKIAAEFGGTAEDRNICGLTPLHYAGLAGFPYHIKELVKMGGDPNALSTTAQSPGYFAALMFNETTLKELFEVGAKKDYTTSEGLTYMHLALENPVMLDSLVKMGLSIEMRNPVNGETPLLSAAHYGTSAGVEWLINHNADEKAVDNKGRDMYEVSRLNNTLNSDEWMRSIVKTIKANRTKQKN